MGLDNGVCVKKINVDEIITKYPNFKDIVEYEYGDSYEIIYWRKWWGPRNRVVEYLCETYDTSYDEYEWFLDCEDITKIIEILNYWDDEETWLEEEASPIWHWDENIHEQIVEDIKKLNILKDMKKAEPDMLIYFYDSY